MSRRHENYPRLSLLLDRLCDQQLTETEARELEQIVQGSPEAAEFYVRYLELHTLLSWDLAFSMAEQTEQTEQSDDAAAGIAPDNIGSRQLIQDLLLEAELGQFQPALAASTSLSSSSLSSSLLPSSLPSSSSSSGLRRSRQRWAGLVTAVCVVLLGGVWGVVSLLPRAEHQMAVREDSSTDPARSEPAERNQTGLAQTETVPAEQPVPEIPLLHWPHLAGQTPRQSSSPPELTSETAAKPQQKVDVAALTDQQLVAAIDQAIAAGWDDFAVTPSPPATPYEWVRRVYLDLAGRIPTTAEVQQFVNSQEPQKREKLVNDLLDSPDFALQWSSRWTNLLVGRSPNERVDRIALLEYLHDSITENQGWDVVVHDLVAAEGNPREQGAANFLVAHLNNQAVPATAFVAKTLLGSQIQCAQCHKHPFYEVTQQEFWELNSFFKQTVVQAADAAGNSMPVEAMTPGAAYLLTDQPGGAATYYETLAGVMKVAYPRFNGQAISLNENVSRREELARLLTSGSDPQIAYAFVNRTWSHFFGHGFTTPVDDLGPHNPPTHPALFRLLAEAFVVHDFDIKKLARWICLSRAYGLSSQLTAGNQQDVPDRGELPAFSRMYSKPLTTEQLYDSLLAIKGEYDLLRRHGKSHLLAREHWVGQFVSSLQNDENDESLHFEGTISQALALMNGDLVHETISPSENPTIAMLSRAALSDVEKFEQLCLLVLSRKPRAEELALFRKLTIPLRNTRTPAEREQLLASRLEDVLWAYLNSSEFIINH